jgi:hypothetical protein
VERQLQHKRGEIADDLRRDVDIIQKREILRHSNLGKRLWKAAAGPDESAKYEWSGPGPKFRKATKLSVNNRWKKLTTRCRGSTTTADPEGQREDDTRADQH